jgi:hypothetical protein
MVEIGRVRVKAGNAPIEQKISAYPPQADICAFVSLETKRAARRPSQGSGRPKCKTGGGVEDRFGSKGEILTASRYFPLYPQDRTWLEAGAVAQILGALGIESMIHLARVDCAGLRRTDLCNRPRQQISISPPACDA